MVAPNRFVSGNVFNVLIIGKTGNGKSSIGNSLLRTPAFSVSRGMSSFTKHTVTQSAQINDMIVKVRQFINSVFLTT